MPISEAQKPTVQEFAAFQQLANNEVIIVNPTTIFLNTSDMEAHAKAAFYVVALVASEDGVSVLGYLDGVQERNPECIVDSHDAFACFVHSVAIFICRKRNVPPPSEDTFSVINYGRQAVSA